MTLLLLTSYGSTGHCWFTASYEDKVGHTSMLFHRPLPLSKDTSSLGFSSVAQSCLTLQPHGTAARQHSLSITNSWSLPKLMAIESVMTSNHPILCCPLLLSSIFPSIRSFQISQLFPFGGQSIEVSASTSSPSSEHPGLISFRMNWLELLTVQGTLKSPQFKSINSALSFLYSPTLTSIYDYWKNHSLD